METYREKVKCKDTLKKNLFRLFFIGFESNSLDLAEAMSRASNSAQMAGTTLDRYIGYLTTITDVTQKSAASVGESLKTVYSRYQNIAAGKFVAAQSDIDSENYDEANWAGLNIWALVG